jgi:opacity protein-like surface antigen
VLVALVVPREAAAQAFISPLIGYDFGGDAGCPSITNCENKALNYGVGVGSMGPILGGEFELAYAKDFFGQSPAFSTSVLTAMGNLLVGPRIGFVQPYGTIGLGLIKTHVEFTTPSLVNSANYFGWDLGGGLMIVPTSHVGVRGDIRYFHAFQDFNILGLTLSNTKLDFGRASAALFLRF